MSKMTEKGVSDKSTKYFLTPSSLAKSLFFYITRCGHYYCSDQYAFDGASEVGQVSSRRNFLLFYIRSGDMSLRLDRHDYTASSNQVVLIDCHRPHAYRATSDLEFIWIHFDGANSAAFFERIRQLNGVVFSIRDGGNLYQMMAALVADCGRQGAASEVTRSRCLHEILCQILLPRIQENERSSSQIEQAIRFICLNLNEHLTVEAVAEAVGLSASHLTRLFRTTVGISPYEYIILQRMDRAKTLLSTTDEPVKTIAFEVGYSSETTFSAAFTEKTGVSPRYYRKLKFYLDH